MPRLSSFIRTNIEPILDEWETFARSLPQGESMDVGALRDLSRHRRQVGHGTSGLSELRRTWTGAHSAGLLFHTADLSALQRNRQVSNPDFSYPFRL